MLADRPNTTPKAPSTKSLKPLLVLMLILEVLFADMFRKELLPAVLELACTAHGSHVTGRLMTNITHWV